jgi:Amt family ammonium transporter
MSTLIQCCASPGFVYPVVSRWVWTEEGWLNQMGYRDFSGCGPVHLLGGTCSLFGATFLGPRLGRFSSKAEDSQEMPGHSVPVRVATH